MSLKCILQGQDLSKESLEAHIADKNNPHGVTPQQIGAATPADIPTSLPASDVYSWAKQPNKPSYTYSEVGAAASNHNHNSLYPTLTDFNSLKTSVSNGKSAVASAITDKGVSTSATASFDTMAGNIRSLPGPPQTVKLGDNAIVRRNGGYNPPNMSLLYDSKNPPSAFPKYVKFIDICNFYSSSRCYLYGDVTIPTSTISSTETKYQVSCTVQQMYYYSGIPTPPWDTFQTTLTFNLVQSVGSNSIGRFGVSLEKIGSDYATGGRDNDWTFNVKFIY